MAQPSETEAVVDWACSYGVRVCCYGLDPASLGAALSDGVALSQLTAAVAHRHGRALCWSGSALRTVEVELPEDRPAGAIPETAAGAMGDVSIASTIAPWPSMVVLPNTEADVSVASPTLSGRPWGQLPHPSSGWNKPRRRRRPLDATRPLLVSLLSGTEPRPSAPAQKLHNLKVVMEALKADRRVVDACLRHGETHPPSRSAAQPLHRRCGQGPLDGDCGLDLLVSERRLLAGDGAAALGLMQVRASAMLPTDGCRRPSRSLPAHSHGAFGCYFAAAAAAAAAADADAAFATEGAVLCVGAQPQYETT